MWNPVSACILEESTYLYRPFMRYPIILLFTLTFLGCLGHAQAQRKAVVIMGKVIDAETKKPLEGANIKVKNSGIGTTTDKLGNYRLLINRRNNFELAYSFVGYEAYTRPVAPNRNVQETDTFLINVQLIPTQEILPTVDVSAERPPPDTVFGSPKYHVEDFEFLDEKRYIFLTYTKSLKRGSTVVLVDENERVLSTAPVDDEAEELFKDFQGYVNVVGRYNIHRIVVEDDRLALFKLPKEEYNQTIKPGIDTLDRKVLFTDYQWYYPEFNYYTFNPQSEEVNLFKHVIDEDQALIYRTQYDFLPSRQKLEARKIAISSGLNKRDVAALMTGFPETFYYTPLYAPLFVVSDTIMIFDHYTDKLYKFNRKAEALDSIDIHYHRDVKPREWERRMICDEGTDKIYAIFQRKGYFYLKEVNTTTGEVTGSFKLYNKYVHKIRVRDGQAYYVYRPYESLQNKFLYKEYIKFE